jgi:hypothetical protein
MLASMVCRLILITRSIALAEIASAGGLQVDLKVKIYKKYIQRRDPDHNPKRTYPATIEVQHFPRKATMGQNGSYFCGLCNVMNEGEKSLSFRCLVTAKLLAAALLAAAPIDASRAADGARLLINGKTGKCLTIAGGTSPANNLQAVQFDCDGDLSRTWRVRRD